MNTILEDDILNAANGVRAAVAAAYAGHVCEVAANDAVASGSPVVAIAEGMAALWARATSLDAAGVNALASAAHHVAQGGFWGRAGDAAAILVAVAVASDPASLSGGPAKDHRFTPPD